MKKNSAADELSYLVKLSKEGDKEAFSMLYEYIYMDLYRYALSVLKNPYFAEDAVSETVLSAYTVYQISEKMMPLKAGYL